MSSSGRSTRNSVSASSMTRLKLAIMPMFRSDREYVIRGSANDATTSGVSSSDALSHTRSRKSPNDCESTLAIDSRKKPDRLKVGIPTVTLISLFATSPPIRAISYDDPFEFRLFASARLSGNRSCQRFHLPPTCRRNHVDQLGHPPSQRAVLEALDYIEVGAG